MKYDVYGFCTVCKTSDESKAMAFQLNEIASILTAIWPFSWLKEGQARLLLLSSHFEGLSPDKQEQSLELKSDP